MAEELQLRIPYGTIAARAWGPKTGKPLVLLHGWLDNAASFDRLAPLLTGHHCVAIDLPGHGRSAHLPDGLNYHLTDVIGHLNDLLDHLQWESCDFVGHSLGGALLALFAGACPERVKKAVFVEALGPHSSPDEEFPERMRQFLEESRRLRLKEKPVYPDKEMAAIARHRVGGLSLEAARTLTERNLASVPKGFTWASDARLRLPSIHRLTEKEVLAFLTRIKCPSLLVVAKEGFLTHPAYRPGVKTRIESVKGIEVVEVDGYHHLHFDNAEPVAKEINRFLK